MGCCSIRSADVETLFTAEVGLSKMTSDAGNSPIASIAKELSGLVKTSQRRVRQ